MCVNKREVTVYQMTKKVLYVLKLAHKLLILLRVKIYKKVHNVCAKKNRYFLKKKQLVLKILTITAFYCLQFPV